MHRLATVSMGGLSLALVVGTAFARPTLTHGVAVGDVTATGATIWLRTDEEAEVLVSIASRELRVETAAERDFTAQIRVDGLKPATSYPYVARAGASEVEGIFRTAPSPVDDAPVRFVFGGDLGGHGYCREEERGYAIFRAMKALEPDFFIANGDMIYADSFCPEERPDGRRNVPGSFPRIDAPDVDWTDAKTVREIFLAHWRYNRADEHFQDLLRRVPVYVQWDDHEVINDFGGSWPRLSAAPERPGFPTLVREGRRALFDFHPIHAPEGEPFRIYRSFRWGRQVELFLLDARSYRSWNDLVDRPEHGKTLLGAEQLAWLERGLASSEAVWKIISTDVPLSLPTGSEAHRLGRDAWANGTEGDFSSRTGFESELRDLLAHLDAADVRNVVFVATDVHFAMTLRYQVDGDGDGDALLFHELVTGPMSAGLADPRAPDPTFRPAILYAEGGVFNFGLVSIEPGGTGTAPSRLEADVRDVDGSVRFGSRLSLEAEAAR